MTSQSASADPIFACMDRWHQHMRGQLEGGLDAVLHPDVVFLSPIVFTPQEGRDITKAYLTAAGGTLGGEERSDSVDTNAKPFEYTKTILQGHHAMLEFETSIDGKAMIVEFKVMIRPLQAVNLVHAQMKAMLERLASQA